MNLPRRFFQRKRGGRMENHYVINKLKNITGIQMLFLAGFFFAGLFHEYASCIFAGLLFVFFSAGSFKKGMRIFVGAESVLIFAAVLMYALTAFWGVDSGMSAVGAAKMTGVLAFALILMQLEEPQRERLFFCIPAAGAAMTLIGAAALPFPALREFFWTDSRRLGGFFQYPNVFALFCLLGFLILAERQRKGSVCMLLLLAGILLSGSRSVFFLTAGAVFFAAVFDKGNRKKMAALFLLCVVFAAGYVAVSGRTQNIGRFFTASFSASTLLGRLIYAQDAFRLLLRHPFGLGYLGYYYMEPEIQTAVYSVRFVHNDILQLALDIGILPCLFFVFVFLKNIISKRNSFYRRLMLAVMGAHLLLDFDLEFMSLWYALVLLLHPVRGKEWVILSENRKKAVRGAALAFAFVCVYFGAAMLPRYFGNPKLSFTLMPFYTEAGKEAAAKEEDMDAAVRMADKLTAQNAYIAEAFDIKAAEACQKQRYGKLISFKKRSLALQKYDMGAYRRYIALLGRALQDAANTGEEEAVMEILSAIAETEDILETVKAQTNPLAYRTRDVPEFSLDSETADYIAQVKGILEEEQSGAEK